VRNGRRYSFSGGQGTFTLAVASDSFFAIMTGSNTVTVYQQAGTELYGLASIASDRGPLATFASNRLLPTAANRQFCL
jgi:hypothetical protein